MPVNDISGVVKKAKVTLLVGVNGSGKSRTLRHCATELLGQGDAVIAINNSPVNRFSGIRSRKFKILSMHNQRNAVTSILKSALCSSDDFSHAQEKIRKTLDYAGFSQRLIAEINIKKFPDSSLLQSKIHDVPGGQRDASLVSNYLEEYVRSSLRLDDESVIARESNVLDERFMRFLRYERYLKKWGCISSIDFFVDKRPDIYGSGASYSFPLEDISSGESALLAIHMYLATQINLLGHKRKTIFVLIDEPENSLHPKWQSEYVTRIYDMFPYEDVHLVAATHSPLVVSGLKSESLSSAILILPNGIQTDPGMSIDAILFEAFGVLTPASHFLSESISDLLTRLSYGEIDLLHVKKEIGKFSSKAYDGNQKKFLEGAEHLAEDVVKRSVEGGASKE